MIEAAGGSVIAIVLASLAVIDADSLVNVSRYVYYDVLWIPVVVLTLYGVYMLTRKLNSMKSAMFDGSAEPAVQYPENYSFVSNRISPAEFKALGERTRHQELQKLYRTEEWRAHIRTRGSREENYNWQTRQRLGLPECL